MIWQRACLAFFSWRMLPQCDCSDQDNTGPLGVTAHTIFWFECTRRDMWCSFYTNPSLAFNSLVRPRHSPPLRHPAGLRSAGPRCSARVCTRPAIRTGPQPGHPHGTPCPRVVPVASGPGLCATYVCVGSSPYPIHDWPRGRAVTGERLVQSMHTRLRQSTRPSRTPPVVRLRGPGRRKKAWGGQWERRCPRGK